MKRLLILLCLSTLTSCGIKNKFLNSTSGTLGVPKQPTEERSITESGVTSTTEVIQQTTQSQPDPTASEVTTESEESFSKWYYAIPFVGLAILAFLVYRLKQQNLKSL